MIVNTLPSSMGKRPSLIQRTSSVDGRHDVTRHTWLSLLSLLKPREYLVTVDHGSIWRKHLSWAKTGEELRTHMMQRYATNMVFMSLLLGSELNVLFNSNERATQMRKDMMATNLMSVEFWIGLTIVSSVVLTIFTLLSTFTAWGMISAVSNENAHGVLRSSMGLYVSYLPSRLIVASIYSFLIWVIMFMFILLPKGWSIFMLVLVLALFFHVVTVFSAFGRLIMHSGAMGSAPIFDAAFEQELLPRGLHTSLLFKAVDELRKGTSVTRQYKFPSQPIGKVDAITASADNGDLGDDTDKGPGSVRFAPGAARFADTIWSSVEEGTTTRTGPVNGGDGINATAAETSDMPLKATALKSWVSNGSLTDGGMGRINGSVKFPLPPLMTPVQRSREGGEGRLPPHPPSINHQYENENRVGGVDISSGEGKWRLSQILNRGNHTDKSLRKLASDISDLSDEDGGGGGTAALWGRNRPHCRASK